MPPGGDSAACPVIADNPAHPPGTEDSFDRSTAMREAVIVSTARTPIGRAFRGALNHVKSPTLMAHAIRHAVQRASVDGAEIEDVVIGTVLTAGTAGMNLARNAA